MSWMRKETDLDRDIPARPARTPEISTYPQEPKPPAARNAHIGRSVHIKGTLVGKEDLTIDGTVEGRIQLEEHVLTIGAHGVIQADVQAKTIIVHGRLEGNASGDDKVEIGATGSVRGDVRAPRVAILDGATFKGGIDMEVRKNAQGDQAKPSSGQSVAAQTSQSAAVAAEPTPINRP